MPRPTTYKAKRVDTKVRIRQDQADALAARVDETGLSRNRLVEQALDAFLTGGPKKPRLQRAPADPRVVKSSAASKARTQPRIAHVGEALADQSEGLAAGRLPSPSSPKTRRSPRRNLG